ncbi:CRISPR-associated ring nuclease Csm6 [uncultured Azohydromonas sp.]|uniref:CRISPR-associated ring nuclease Csm6 n=1 Tax=uncultured Azohydromonas sp. TaxID=487342 RepID=UPI00261AC3FB|nr:CRISPR-associated ring nuclease Csm6 [uncultured Azohydromonas sp.]
MLLAVTGLSPQVVTETIYALAVMQQPAFVPTEVHVITTATGAHKLKLALLSQEPGWFARLRHDYGLADIAFDEHHIHVVPDAQGQPLADIRDLQENRLAADFITERVREFTADANCALHVSLAGGRKTMGFFVGYALSLFGRVQDSLSHVLVNEPYERSMDFYYPTPYSQVIKAGERELADAAEARVTLADIPIVSLRHGLPQELLAGRAGFDATVQAARRALAPAELVLDLRRGCIRASGQVVRLPRVQLALLAMFARRALVGAEPLPAPPVGAGDVAMAQLYLHELRQVAGPLGDTERTEERLKQGMEGDFFSQTKSFLHKSLDRALNVAAAPYRIDGGKKKPYRYRLSLPASAIRFADIEADHEA